MVMLVEQRCPSGGSQVRWAAVENLRAADGPRSGSLVQEVVDSLVFGRRGGHRWPPLVVHGGRGTVVDGAHRLQAARVLELDRIEVIEVLGSAEDALLAGVRANHLAGRPLSAGDRRRAVERIVRAFPQMPYREVMAATGASAGVVNRARAAAGLCGVPEPRPAQDIDPQRLLQRLCSDPAMRRSPEGTTALRTLGALVATIRRGAGVIPAHRAEHVAALLRWCADEVAPRQI